MQQILSSGLAEQTIQKSRFIALAAYVDSERAVAAVLRQLATDYPNASHLAYAFRLKTPEGIVLRCSDDGEPSGTAGKPIIPHLEGRDLINVCVGVIRYYGGINLGTGGLVRAYAGTAKMALDNAQIGEFIEQAEFELTLNYKQIDAFKRELAQMGGELIHADFAEHIHLTIRLPIRAWDALRQHYPQS